MIEIQLPYPPTINHYYVIYRGKPRISPEGRAYHQAVWLAVKGYGIKTVFKKHVKVAVDVWMPDRRKRDVDNILKPLLDACTKADVWRDDSQVKVLTIRHCGYDPPAGRVVVRVEEIRDGKSN